jgi:hypothetical protein
MRAAIVRVALAPLLLACGVARPSSSQGPGGEVDAARPLPLLRVAPADAAVAPVSSAGPATPPEESAAADAGSAPPSTFTPRDVGPLRAGGPEADGKWSPVSVENDGGAPAMWKTVLHPDKAHPSAELFVVVIDLARARLHSVAGASEPATEVPAAKGHARTAVIPADRRDVLLAAFDGGWKGEHGHYGIKVDGVTLVKPREGACTIAAYEDDSVRIGPWADLADGEPRMRLFRQTPPCMYARGARHAGLAAETTTNWGAAANGDPVIRRSAIGLNEARDALFVSVSNAMTAPAIADGMHHAGAHDVAELDVNWSFPKFLVFARNATGALEASSLFAGFVSTKGEYVRQPSARDFFYLARR